MKNKWILWPLALVLAGSLLVGCSSTNTNGTNDADSKDVKTVEKRTIRFGSHLAENHSLVIAAKKFAEIVGENTNGNIDVQIFPNGTIGQQRDLIEGMQLGTIDMSINDPGLMSNFAPRVGILDLPYMFNDYDHVRKTLDGEVGKALADDLLKQGIRSLAWTGTAFRDVLTNEKVKSFDDMKGLKLRSPEAPIYFNTMKAFGANPTPIPWGDTYTALQTGVVDGMEGSAESVFTAKMNEVTKYLIRTQHIFTAISINISEKTWQKLSADDQKIMLAAAKEAADYAWDLNIKGDKEFVNKLLSEGKMTEIKVDLAPFKESVKSVNSDYAKKVDAQDLVDKIQK